MKANFTQETRNNRVSIGSLYQFELLREQFARASHLEGNLPVLSCMVPQEHAHLLGAGRIETRVGYGRFELDGGHQLQTIQIQINSVLFAWVTDMDDDVVWGAIDVWRAVGQLPLMLRLDKGNRWQPLCAVLKAPTGALGNDIYRDEEDSRSTSERASQLLEVVSSGRMQAQAKPLIPEVPVRHVFVSAMLTGQVRQLADVSAFVPPGKSLYGL